jgi:hypothetical protein
MEPPTTIYSFRIVNKTNSCLITEIKSVKDKEINDDAIDTINPNMFIEKEIFTLGCFEDYHDTLMQSFFSEFTIKLNNCNIKIDPYKISNWTTNSNKLSGFGNCKGGFVYYTFEINEKDLK